MADNPKEDLLQLIKRVGAFISFKFSNFPRDLVRFHSLSSNFGVIAYIPPPPLILLDRFLFDFFPPVLNL